jgi:hypothetical protein
MTVVRSRRAGIGPDEAKNRPFYARVLGLQYLRPSGLLCFLYFEGAIALGALLALAELVDWWVVLVLPATIAVMVKINDVIAGASLHAVSASIPKARGRAKVPPGKMAAPVSPAPAEGDWRSRQSASHRYE